MSGIRSKGVIKKWFDDKGFGFITPDKGGKEIFIHVTAFDKNIARKPKVGDTVFFYIGEDKDGRSKAVDAVIEGVDIITPQKHTKQKRYPQTSKRKGKSRWRMVPLLIVLFIAIGSMVIDRLGLTDNLKPLSQAPKYVKKSSSTKMAKIRYTCKGKTRCNQMRSCEEAMFYIQNCPGTKMDGDGDGIPCERQWCN